MCGPATLLIGFDRPRVVAGGRGVGLAAMRCGRPDFVGGNGCQ